MVCFFLIDVSSFFFFFEVSANVLCRKTCQALIGKELCTVNGSKSHNSKDTRCSPNITCIRQATKGWSWVMGVVPPFKSNKTSTETADDTVFLLRRSSATCLVHSYVSCFLGQEGHQVLKGRGEEGMSSVARAAWLEQIQ